MRSGHDAQPHPPDRQPRQAGPGRRWQTGRRCRCECARASRTRQTRARTGAASRRRCGPSKRIAAQHEATEAIAQRQRIAVAPSPVRNSPLKSVVHTSLTARDRRQRRRRPRARRRRRRRGVTKPARFQQRRTPSIDSARPRAGSLPRRRPPAASWRPSADAAAAARPAASTSSGSVACGL